jgi:3',5'-cyclic AMP phosphodiesterase CpdA
MPLPRSKLAIREFDISEFESHMPSHAAGLRRAPPRSTTGRTANSIACRRSWLTSSAVGYRHARPLRWQITFLQISDSHVGFDKPANPNVIGTLEEAIAKVKSLPGKPSFMIHTGDITHLSKPAEFDDAQGVISRVGLDVHYVPGEHDLLDEDTKLYRERYGKNARGAGWYSFDAGGMHFVGLVNVVNLKAGGLGNLGEEQLKWLADDLKGKSAETPIVVFAHIPSGAGAPTMAGARLSY